MYRQLRLRSIEQKNTKSGNMLKTEIDREELGFASDNLSANFNTCSRILIFVLLDNYHTISHNSPIRNMVRIARYAEKRCLYGQI